MISTILAIAFCCRFFIKSVFVQIFDSSLICRIFDTYTNQKYAKDTYSDSRQEPNKGKNFNNIVHSSTLSTNFGFSKIFPIMVELSSKCCSFCLSLKAFVKIGCPFDWFHSSIVQMQEPHFTG